MGGDAVVVTGGTLPSGGKGGGVGIGGGGRGCYGGIKEGV